MNKFGGGPVGLDTLSAATGEESTTIEEAYEPFLIQQGMIARTSKGRVAMPKAFEHLGAHMDENQANQLHKLFSDLDL